MEKSPFSMGKLTISMAILKNRHNSNWLVVWNHGILNDELHILGISSSLTNSIIVQRGRYTTNQ